MRLVIGLVLAVIYSYFILPKKEKQEPKIKYPFSYYV